MLRGLDIKNIAVIKQKMLNKLGRKVIPKISKASAKIQNNIYKNCDRNDDFISIAVCFLYLNSQESRTAVMRLK